MRTILCLLLVISFGSLRAEESALGLMLGAKAGVYQTSGNLFADKTLQGGGITLKLIPDDFGKAGDYASWIGGLGWMLSLDLDNLSGRSHTKAHYPFSAHEDIQMAWNVVAVYACSFTRHIMQLCLGLPFSNSLYLEQNLGGESFNSFSMGNKNPPIFLNLISAHKPYNFGAQWSTSYWNPTFAGVRTHFNLIQAQLFAGYVF
ncbi:MAG TPA: hypothetical protein VE954_02225 [Oligoflexus sp.]|uniref:hypothetical protein n=1 Tax=Oligoflexus sp. TaxID=1971216 RepID=UPI002D41AAC9|nr:hypothetical protein [Oligoflexus sp.]HYX31903.1 hypothetical protein [Oligoflexus sp.]